MFPDHGTRRLRHAIGVLAAVAVLTASEAVAQGADSALLKRLDALDETVGNLGKQIAELGKLLRTVIPSPIEDVQPFEVGLTNAVIKGSTHAKIVILEFSDFQCPFCRQHATTTSPQVQRQLVDTGKVRYAFRNLPIESIHPNAFKAAEAAQCAAEQGHFWEMHSRLFENQQALGILDLLGHAKSLDIDQTKFQSCVNDGRMTARIQQDLAEARRLGLTGTPTFLIGAVQPDGGVRITRRITGVQPLQIFQAAIEGLLPTASDK